MFDQYRTFPEWFHDTIGMISIPVTTNPWVGPLIGAASFFLIAAAVVWGSSIINQNIKPGANHGQRYEKDHPWRW